MWWPGINSVVQWITVRQLPKKECIKHGLVSQWRHYSAIGCRSSRVWTTWKRYLERGGPVWVYYFTIKSCVVCVRTIWKISQSRWYSLGSILQYVSWFLFLFKLTIIQYMIIIDVSINSCFCDVSYILTTPFAGSVDMLFAEFSSLEKQGRISSA
jgi:hypothetical protein